MKDLAAGIETAIAEQNLSVRDLVWVTVRDFDDDSAHSVGFWNDLGDVSMDVIDGITGNTVSRLFHGAGSLLAVDEMIFTADVSIREVGVHLSPIDNEAIDAFRGYDAKGGKIQIYRAYFNDGKVTMAAAAYPRFVGFIDEVTIVTPAENEAGTISLSCVSHTRELTRINPDTRTVAGHKKRGASDNFHRYAGSAVQWDIFWGVEKQKLGKKKKGTRF